jgi:aquaporin Z
VLGAIAAAFMIYLLISGQQGVDMAAQTFASNGYAEHSPGGFNLTSGFIAEVLLTFIFLLVILGVTDNNAPVGFAGLAIGLCLTLIHLVGIPITNVSVNPARSTGPALAALMTGNGWALQQLWLFWVAPIIGAALASGVYRWMADE